MYPDPRLFQAVEIEASYCGMWMVVLRNGSLDGMNGVLLVLLLMV
jgi:hypothetical protein